MGIEHIRNLKALAEQPKVKQLYSIPKKSKKKLLQEAAQRAVPVDPLESFFYISRKRMTGTCQCGCGNKSQKDNDKFYRHSVAHIFPKAIFESIKVHPLNWVERAFWGGCHGTFDSDMDKWPGMADWDDIVNKVLLLYPLLTEEEQAHKFTTKLISLIYKQPA